MFRSVLIANRGEIALRIARTCRRLGIRTVQAYSSADREAPWLAVSDETLCIGGGRVEESYLNADAVLQAAEQSGCQAIHPGYGFLSENARFAARCEQQGITFVGPSAGQIRRMGDKAAAKNTLARAGLPTIPGSEGTLRDLEQARSVALEVGYPLLLKAAAGGGGKGMRRCDSEADLPQALSEATLEAEKAFGDPALYVERYIEGGRHIEFQILGDAYGQAIHLGERECSVQRHHQKLIEESPSPVIPAALRASFGGRVAEAVARAGYCNAGTVEFLRAPDGELYFMEMNTRLQVEHPVTEMVTGVDLVEQQLRIAANEPLSLEQSDVLFEGHAIELRINAEDPSNGFRPDPGRIDTFRAPPEALDGARVRWDSAIAEGYRVPPYYDSMLGKLIVHAADREGAIRGAEAALAALHVGGVCTTAALHRDLLGREEFRRGEYDLDSLALSGLIDEQPAGT